MANATKKNSAIKTFGASEISELVNKGGFQNLLADLIGLEVGEGIEGRYVATGSFDAQDPKTGEMRAVSYYELDVGDNNRVRLNGKTVLDQAFSKIKEGQFVVVIRKPDVKTSAKRTAQDFTVLAK